MVEASATKKCNRLLYHERRIGLGRINILCNICNYFLLYLLYLFYFVASSWESLDMTFKISYHMYVTKVIACVLRQGVCQGIGRAASMSKYAGSFRCIGLRSGCKARETPGSLRPKAMSRRSSMRIGKGRDRPQEPGIRKNVPTNAKRLRSKSRRAVRRRAPPSQRLTRPGSEHGA